MLTGFPLESKYDSHEYDSSVNVNDIMETFVSATPWRSLVESRTATSCKVSMRRVSMLVLIVAR